MGSFKKYIIGFFLLVIVNAIAGLLNKNFDLTSDKRYTVGEKAIEMSKAIEEDILITVFLEGNIPSSFKKYRDFIDYYLKEIKNTNKKIRVTYLDPTKGSKQELIDIKRYFQSYGITPISRKVTKEDGLNQSVLYPYLSVENDSRVIFVDLLESKQSGQTEQEAIHFAQINFEPKLTKAIRDIAKGASGLVGVIGEGKELLAAGLNNEKGRLGNYFYLPMNAEGLAEQIDTIELVISMLGEQDLQRDEQLLVDQALMRGVPILWMVDKFIVGVDSIGKYGTYMAIANNHMSYDQLFKYGFRVGSELIMDVECSPIPQVVGTEGGKAQTTLIEFPFHPILTRYNQIFDQLVNPVQSKFITDVQVLDNRSEEYIPLLSTSPYTQKRKSPTSLDFNFLRVEPFLDDYSSGTLDWAIYLRDEQRSYFNNRLTSADNMLLERFSIKPISKIDSVPQIIIGDIDFAMPTIASDGSILPIGYNIWDRKLYDGNKLFLSSCFELLINNGELLSVQKRNDELRLIDSNLFNQKAMYYYFLILGIPMLSMLMLVFGLGYYRKLKYA